MHRQQSIFYQQLRGRPRPTCRVCSWWKEHHRPRGSLQPELRRVRGLSARSRSPETLQETQAQQWNPIRVLQRKGVFAQVFSLIPAPWIHLLTGPQTRCWSPGCSCRLASLAFLPRNFVYVCEWKNRKHIAKCFGAAKVKRMSYKNGSFTCKKLKSASSYSGSEKKKARKLLFHISHYVCIFFVSVTGRQRWFWSFARRLETTSHL